MSYRSKPSRSGTDDIPQRVSLLCTMALLLGYGANASGLVLHDGEYDGKPVQAFDGLKAAMAFFLVAKAVRFTSTIVYAVCLPPFRKAQLASALAIFISVSDRRTA